MMEALSSSKTSVLVRATRRNLPEDAILHSHRRENLKSYAVPRSCILLLSFATVYKPLLGNGYRTSVHSVGPYIAASL
jgi:hypothetical protein